MAANEDLFDALVRHQIGLMRLSGSIQKRILELLDQSDQAVLDRIRLRVEGRQLDASTLRRLTRLERGLRSLRNATWSDIERVWREEMEALVVQEPKFTSAAVRTTLPVVVDTVLPPTQLLKSLVRSRPFQGRSLREWAAKQSRDDLGRILGQIRVGMVQGESPDVLVGRVRSVLNTTRRDAEFVTRTAVNHFSNQARRIFLEENAEVFSEELYVATLDSRTTAICRSLDGKRYPVGQGPIPPLHPKCRSTRTAVLNGEVLGVRPLKPVTERMLVREFARERGVSIPGSLRRVNLPRGTKGAFDRFARTRVRELVGTVPAKTTYSEFLQRQSVEFQNEVLGRTKAQLFRRGKLSLDKFVNRRGDELTLSELAQSERSAFVAAGLDPEDFL